jgi:hypothetical protein
MQMAGLISKPESYSQETRNKTFNISNKSNRNIWQLYRSINVAIEGKTIEQVSEFFF